MGTGAGIPGLKREEWLTPEELITPDAQPENFCIGSVDDEIACAFILQWADSGYYLMRQGMRQHICISFACAVNLQGQT